MLVAPISEKKSGKLYSWTEIQNEEGIYQPVNNDIEENTYFIVLDNPDNGYSVLFYNEEDNILEMASQSYMFDTFKKVDNLQVAFSLIPFN